jgi:prophage DNA circulation protein
MAWTDRIREAAYTSPSGVRLTFDYENVSKTVDKKTTSFEFPDANGSYVQDLGNTGRQYPLRVFFWGGDYDLRAEAFEAALLERGTGKLEHPIYGTVNVVPFGTITRRDDLKTGANQAVFEIVFFETIGLIYPSSQTDPASSVLAAVDEYNDAAAQEFDDVTSLDNAVDAVTFKNEYRALLDSVSSGLQSIANEQDNVRTQFNAVRDSINQGIDVLIADPLTLAFQTLILLQAPARALTIITARLDAYKNLADSIITGNNAVVTPSFDSRSSNLFHINDLYASTYLSGSVVSVVNTQFTTKTEALTAAEFILTQLDDLNNWRDANFKALAEIDTGAAYQQLQEAVALTAGFLVEISFTLRQERRVVLDRNRTIINLVAEFYGSVDDQLDFFINSNSLTGSEILEVPRGREVVYYI